MKFKNSIRETADKIKNSEGFTPLETFVKNFLLKKFLFPADMVYKKMCMVFKENRSNKNRLLTGFTLIEIIVSMAVFLLVLGTATSIFLSIVKEQRRILSEQEFINQTSYAIEYMSKALRMAKTDEFGECVIEPGKYDNSGGIYVLTRYDSTGGFYMGIRFLNASNTNASGEPICQEFFLDGNADDGYILKEIKSIDSLLDTNISSATPLTSEKLKISSARFGINGSNGTGGETDYAYSGDLTQPRVTISLEAQLGINPGRIIQTTISQRNLNAAE